MSSTAFSGNEPSVGEPTPEHLEAVEHDPVSQSTCPECEGHLITEQHESFCEDCGLVVATNYLDRRPTLVDLGLVGFKTRSSIEPVDPFRTDKGLHTKILTGNDGYGKPLAPKQRRKFHRLKKWHKRFQFDGERGRAKRLNEALRDIEMLGGNLALPEYVTLDAARWLKQASEARLPGGHMAWESLAAGAVLLAIRNAGVPREDTEVALYAKATHERTCAAARKLRMELDLDIPPVRSDPVDEVLEALGDTLSGGACLRLLRVGEHLLELADEAKIGPGTSRLTVAAAAVYAADRLTDEKSLTQQQVVNASSTIVKTSTSKLGQYSRELYDAYVERHGTDDPSVVFDRSGFQVG